MYIYITYIYIYTHICIYGTRESACERAYMRYINTVAYICICILILYTDTTCIYIYICIFIPFIYTHTHTYRAVGTRESACERAKRHRHFRVCIA